MPTNPIRQYWEQLRRDRARDKATYGRPPPLPEPPVEMGHSFRLQHGDQLPPGTIAQELEDRAPLTVPEVREEIYQRIIEYAGSDSAHVLLIRVPAGVGKTYHAVRAAQDLCLDHRILYCAGRHAFWDDLAALENFRTRLWYHWLPIHEGDEEAGMPETCRYAKHLKTWIRRGYPGIALCLQICAGDGHLPTCFYRCQAKQKEPIIFAMHQHLTCGLAISDFSLAIIDEMPLHAFWDKRRIPQRYIVPEGQGAMTEIFRWLEYLVAHGDEGKRGKELLDIVGPDLERIFEQVEAGDEMRLPTIPRIESLDQVKGIPYYYWQDLLRKLSPEFECWKAGWPAWVSRVRTYPKWCLEILGRKSAWEHLPNKVVALDATGNADIYQALLGREIETYEPQVDRPGRIYQVVARLNGAGTVLEPTGEVGPRGGKQLQLAPKGHEMLEMCKMIAAAYGDQRVGIITYKWAKPEFIEVFGAHNVMHYGAVRGSNLLQDVACLIVAGGYCPPLIAVQDYAAMLYPKRLKPFVQRDDDGAIIKPWRPVSVEYRTRQAGHWWRVHSGYWLDEHLRVMLEQSRASEIVQAAHRARPNVREVDVWILTSVPLVEVVDLLMEDLSDSWLAPDGIPWGAWLKLQPFLDLWHVEGVRVTVEMVAEVAGVSRRWALDKKWLRAIVAHAPDLWEEGSIRPKGAGRGRLCLLAK